MTAYIVSIDNYRETGKDLKSWYTFLIKKFHHHTSLAKPYLRKNK